VSPRSVTNLVHRDVPPLQASMRVGEAVGLLLESGLPALPVVDDRQRYAGIFGEREFVGALFPGYLRTLGYAGFVPKPIDEVIEKRRECAVEPVSEYMNTEHIDVPVDASDVQIAETFLNHRVLIVPVVDERRSVCGLITRSEFFRALAERFLTGIEPRT
jgi:CBS domain-containing protein